MSKKLTWEQWADDLVAAEQVAPKMRAEGWFTVNDLHKKTGWTIAKCRMRCIHAEETGELETQLASDTNAKGSVVETSFYRRKQ